MKRYLPYIVFFALVLAFILLPETAMAQCPMCKASVESSLKGGSKVAVGINKGILYLLVMPYLFYAVIFFAWWRKSRRKVVVG